MTLDPRPDANNALLGSVATFARCATVAEKARHYDLWIPLSRHEVFGYTLVGGPDRVTYGDALPACQCASRRFLRRSNGPAASAGRSRICLRSGERTRVVASSSRSAAAWPWHSGLSPTRALLNDANPHLINFYRWLQRGLVADLEMANDESLFNRQRARFNDLLQSGGETSAEAAALFYFLNRTGYNGLCRFNKQGEFNVPFGRYKRISYGRDFTPYAEPIRNWAFTNVDFAELERSRPTTSSTPIRPTTSSSPRTRRADSRGTTRRASPNGFARHRGPVVLVNQSHQTH